MTETQLEAIAEEAKRVLSQNDTGQWTIPAKGVYPHQWLWDSCFIAIGLRHIDPTRAATELRSIFRGQWNNGMVPNMVFTQQPHKIDDSNLWRSRVSPDAPKDVATSGITQPPMLARAILDVSKKLPKQESINFLKELYPKLIEYHQWLYRDRDPQGDGLIVVLHPWETGLDNAPAWQVELRSAHKPHWITLLSTLRLTSIPLAFRRDTKNLSGDTRIRTLTALKYAHAAMGLKKRKYDSKKVLQDAHFAAYSLSFNSIVISANACLKEIAKTIGEQLPAELESKFDLAKKNIVKLYDQDNKKYNHYSLRTRRFINEPSISSLLPLYSGAISQEHADQIVKQLKKSNFWTKYPVPSVPTDSNQYEETRFWLGPTWINTNWLLIDGLKSYGYKKEAKLIEKSCLELVEKSGMREYFSAKDGQGYGAVDFSWTAALTLDILNNKK